MVQEPLEVILNENSGTGPTRRNLIKGLVSIPAYPLVAKALKVILTAAALAACATIDKGVPVAQTEHFRVWGLGTEKGKQYAEALENDLEKLVTFTGRPMNSIADVNVGGYEIPFGHYLGPMEMPHDRVATDSDPRTLELARMKWGLTSWGAATALGGFCQFYLDKSREVFPLFGKDIYQATPWGANPIATFKDFSSGGTRRPIGYYLDSMSFGAFLIEKFGIDKFLDFNTCVAADRAKGKIDAIPNSDLIVFGERLVDLKKQWEERVRSGQIFNAVIEPSNRKIPYGNQYDRPASTPQITIKNSSRIQITESGYREIRRRAEYAYRVTAAIFGKAFDGPLTIEVTNRHGFRASKDGLITQSWASAPVGMLTIMYAMQNLLLGEEGTFEVEAIGSYFQHEFDEKRGLPMLGGDPVRMLYFNPERIMPLEALARKNIQQRYPDLMDRIFAYVEGIAFIKFTEEKLFQGDKRKAVLSLARIMKGESPEAVYGASYSNLHRGMMEYIREKATK